MIDLDAPALERMIEESRLEEAARALNDRYREVSGKVLDVFEDLLHCSATASFLGDLRNLGHLLRLGPPSRRNLLKIFLTDPRGRNCLTSVLATLEKEVPVSVRMGFTGVSSFFRQTDFAGTYHTDIIHYEPELSQLTDQRLVRLLSHPPNTMDLELLDQAAADKREEVLKAYREESLEPLKVVFRDTAARCLEFLVSLEEHALAFRKFFDGFREKDFATDSEVMAEWTALGEEFFHLEQAKSSLMLPISPKALYWGMQKDYSRTLARLRELKEMVTPEFVFTERGDGGEWAADIECLNPGSIAGEGFLIEPGLRYETSSLAGEQGLQAALVPVSPPRRYELRLRRTRHSGAPLPLTLRISCRARCYRLPFVVEKPFLLEAAV